MYFGFKDDQYYRILNKDMPKEQHIIYPLKQTDLFLYFVQYFLKYCSKIFFILEQKIELSLIKNHLINSFYFDKEFNLNYLDVVAKNTAEKYV